MAQSARTYQARLNNQYIVEPDFYDIKINVEHRAVFSFEEWNHNEADYGSAMLTLSDLELNNTVT